MRRFASVFIPKLNTSDQPTHSSSASSSASTSVSAHTSPSVSSHKKSWLPSWLPKKSKPHIIVRPSIPDWNPLSQPTPLPVLVHTDDDTSEDSDDDDNDDDEDEDDNDNENENENDDDDDDVDDDHNHYQPVPSPLTASSPVHYLHSLISSSLAHTPSPPPLFHIPGTPLFPRSSNSPHHLPFKDTLQSRMHKSHLLHRLSNLSPSDHLYLRPFTNKPIITTTNYPTAPPIDEHAVDPSHISSASSGLRLWMARPCFEDRFSVSLLPHNSTTITTHMVTSSGFAVAELEFSEALESLAGLNLPPADSLLEQPPSREQEPEPPSPSSSLLSVPVVPRNAPYKALPSPLRMQHGPSTLQSSPVQSTTASMPTPPPPAEPEPQTAVVKRGVHFAEDGKEDQVPLAYVLRIQKQREEKAKFLREERERRAWEEERRKQDRERMEREKERREWERERKAWELEKKAMEEERKARLYAEEVAAARLRRENARAGGIQVLHPSAASTPVLAVRDSENRHTRDSRSYLRPAYDAQRRHVSESAVPATEYGGGGGGSSQPSSLGHGGGGSPSGSGSRPPSLYSSLSSSEDGRQREAQIAGSKKRTSITSSSSHRPTLDHHASSYTGASNLVPPVPPVPPPFAMDVPLLPPTPPFMMQQYPRRPRSSQSSSSGSSKQKLPRNNSADGVDPAQQLPQQQQQRPHKQNGSASPSPKNVQQQQQQQQQRPYKQNGSASLSPKNVQQQPQPQRSHKQNGSAPSSPKNAQQQQQQQQQQQRRRASGDNFPPSRSSDRGRMRASASAHSHSQPNSYSRGTIPQLVPFMPVGPSYLYPQSPWTALPTMAQLHDAPMSMTLNTRPPLGPRQTTIS